MNDLLSKREFKVFEDDFQWLNNFPSWTMENIFTSGTLESDQLDKFSRMIYTGKSRLNRLNIAAHEAAHAVVMEATYCRVDRVLIDVEGDPGGLLGCVEPYRNDASDHQSTKQKSGMPCKPRVAMDLLVIAAGFVGESFTGKQTGSNHEKFTIYCKCRYLDDLNEVEPLTNWKHHVGWCRKIILNNESLFWRVTDDLLATSELTEPLKILLHNNIKKEPTELFF